MQTEARKNIFISYNLPGYEEQVKADLQKIEENPIGKRLIKKIAAGAHLVFIKYGDKSECEAWNEPCSCDPKRGSASDIFYAPVARVGYTDKLQPLEMPGFIGLFHELVHAHHNSRGKNAQTNNYDKRVWTDDEEYHTIMGFPSKKPHRETPKITENAFLIAQGLPCRYAHLSFASFQHNPYLAAYLAASIKLEKAKTLAKIFHDSLPKPNSLPKPITTLPTKDLPPVDKRIASVWNTIFGNPI